MYKYSLIWVAVFGIIALMFLRLPQMAAKQDAVLNTYSALVEVDALAKQRFVEPIGDERLVDGAIRGMLLTLDPYSGYIAPDELPAFERHAAGEYIGIGIEVGMQDGRLTVIAPIEGTPAARAGIVAGDVIHAINGRDVKGLSAFDVERLLGGAPGTTVRLRLQHPRQRDPEALTVTRGPVSILTVRGFRRDASGRWEYLIDPAMRVGYIRVSSFLNNTMDDFGAALDSLSGQDARGLILDLRFNPGGMMHQAVAMVDRFVDSGVILSTVTRRRAVQEYLATPIGTMRNIKLVVLINGASASASEIVVGSLQAHDRALIVGERSFGKGSVQHLIYLTETQGAIKLTTAYYRLPDGRIIHRTAKNAHSSLWGVRPDVEITLNDAEKHAIQDSRRLLDLAYAQPVDPSGSSKTAVMGDRADDTEPLEILRDRQLLEALTQIRHQIEGNAIQR